MTATSHALVGVTIAAAIHNPIIAIPVALASHVICDFVPHWDIGTFRKKKNPQKIFVESVIDVFISLISSLFLLFFVFKQTPIIYGLFIAFIAQLLDWLTAPYYVLNWKFPPFSLFYSFQHFTNTKLNKPWGIITQIVVVLLTVILVKSII